MSGGFQVARILGIPIVINISWLVLVGGVTTVLALWLYPSFFDPPSPYHDDKVLHWTMAVISGLVFCASILLHELAHSVVAVRQGIPVQNITFFMFGGVSQISGEARRPLHEFVMAIVGPFTSLVLAAIFLTAWWLFTGAASDEPVALVLQWLGVMNLILAVFNMAPGFPMDGGRVLRSVIWGISGSTLTATRVATWAGRGFGYGLVVVGGLALFGVLREYMNPITGMWLIFIGLYLENSARQSWLQAKALDLLSSQFAEDLMKQDLETARQDERLHYLAIRGGNHFFYFVTDDEERVIGVITEKEVLAVPESNRGMTTASEVMRPTGDIPVATPREDASSLLQRMEQDQNWHMPVISEGRAVGVVSKEDILRVLARSFFPKAAEASTLPH